MAGLFSSIQNETYNKYKDIFSFIRYITLSKIISAQLKSVSITQVNINYYLIMDTIEFKNLYIEYAKYNSESNKEFDNRMLTEIEFVNKFGRKRNVVLVIPINFIYLNNDEFIRIARTKYMR